MKKFAFLFVALTVFAVNAQNGSNNNSWENVDYNAARFLGPNGADGTVYNHEEVTIIREFPDGKLLLIGRFDNYNDTVSPHIVKLNQDGKVDSSFSFSFIQGWISGAVILNNGNIMLTGTIRAACSQETDGECFGNVMILSPTGDIIYYSADISITTSTTRGNSFLLPDGKVLVNANFFDESANYYARSLVRLNSDGTVDYTFADSQTGIKNILADFRDFDVQSDGKIIAVGSFTTTYDGTVVRDIIRLNSDGSYDNTFFSNSNDNDQNHLYAVKVAEDDKIMIGGYFFHYNDVQSASRLVRLNPGGTLDNTFTSFDESSSSGFGEFYDIAIQNDGKIIAAGNINGTYESQNIKKVMRFNVDGTLDTTYKHTSEIGDNLETIYVATLLSNNKIIFGGDFESFQHSDRKKYVCRVTSDGVLDASFNPAVGCNDGVMVVKALPDGDLLIGGRFNEYGSYTRFGIVKINSNGEVDESFNLGADLEGATISDILVQSDGKVLVGGYSINTVQGTSINGLFRLNSDLTLDTSFNTNMHSESFVLKMDIQNDGKIVVVGSTPYKRYNSDGSPDLSFNLPQGLGGTFRNVMVQSNQKIIFIGSLTYVVDNVDLGKNIIRLNSDGSYDPSFLTGTGTNNNLYDIVERPDGKILVSGALVSFNGDHVGDLFLLESNGELDTTFSSEVETYSSIFKIKLLANNKIVVGGSFSSIDSHPTKSVGLLNSDGATDTSFLVESVNGTSGIVRAIELDSENNLVVGGGFTEFNYEHKGHLNRVDLNEPSLSIDEILITNKVMVFPNPVKNNLKIKSEKSINSVSIYDINGRLLNHFNPINLNTEYKLEVSHLVEGIYILNIESGNRKQSIEIVKE